MPDARIPITATFVSIHEARHYFRLWGSVPVCEGHERISVGEWEEAGEPTEKVWGFVQCRIGHAEGPLAREAGIHSGDVLTFGIP